MIDLIRRSDVLEALEQVFDKYGILWDQKGGLAEAVPNAIRSLPAVDVDCEKDGLEDRE